MFATALTIIGVLLSFSFTAVIGVSSPQHQQQRQAPPTPFLWGGPYGVAVNRVGNIYMSDPNFSRLIVFSSAGDVLRTINVTSMTPPVQSPGMLTVDRALHLLYIHDAETLSITVLGDGGGGYEQIAVYNATDIAGQTVTGVGGIAADDRGHLYVTGVLSGDVWAGFVYELNGQTGRVLRQIVPPTPYWYTSGITVDVGGGHIYVLNSSYTSLTQYNRAGNITNSWSLYHVWPDPYSQMAAATVDTAGMVYVVGVTGSWVPTVVKIDPFNGNIILRFRPTPRGLGTPTAMAVDMDNKLYLSSPGARSVLVFNANGNVTLPYIGPPLPSFNGPTAIYQADVTYVADTGNNRIIAYDSYGYLQRVYTTANPPLKGPTGMSVVGDTLNIVDTGNNRIVQLRLRDGVQVGVIGGDGGSDNLETPRSREDMTRDK